MLSEHYFGSIRAANQIKWVNIWNWNGLRVDGLLPEGDIVDRLGKVNLATKGLSVN